MARIQVPENAVEQFSKLLSLNDEKRAKLLGALRKVGPSLTLNELADNVAAECEIRREIITTILSLVLNLFMVREELLRGTADQFDFAKDIEKFATEVCASAEGDYREKLKGSATKWSKSREFLSAALSLEKSLGVTAKAIFLMTDHQHAFFGQARIYSDVRHVFSSDVSKVPEAAVIVHMLKLPYIVDGAPQDFYVALDSRDLSQLLRIVERAMDKERTLRELLQKARVTCLQPTS